MPDGFLDALDEGPGAEEEADEDEGTSDALRSGSVAALA